jgi:hypothetical protein
MVKIPTAEELTGTQVQVTPGAKPNFLLPSGSLSSPFLQMADASARAGSAVVDFATSLQDAKNKTILNNAVLSMKGELQTYEQELYRGKKNVLLDGTIELIQYDPFEMGALLLDKKNDLIRTYVTNNKDAKGLLGNQIKSTFELEWIEIADAVNKEANKRIDKDHILSVFTSIDMIQAELIRDINMDEETRKQKFDGVIYLFDSIAHKVPSQTLLAAMDSFKRDVTEGQFLNFTKNLPIQSIADIADKAISLNFENISNAGVAQTMRELWQTNPDMVQGIFDAAIKQKMDVISMEDKLDIRKEKFEKRETNKFLRTIYLTDTDVGSEEDRNEKEAAIESAFENLKKLQSVDWKTLDAVERYIDGETVFAEDTLQSTYLKLKTNIELGLSSFADVIGAAGDLSQEDFQELMSLQSAELNNLKSTFGKLVMNKYGIIEEAIDTDNPIHMVITSNAAKANNEWQEWMADPENKRIATTSLAEDKKKEIFDKYNQIIKDDIVAQMKQGIGQYMNNIFSEGLPDWFDFSDLRGTIKTLQSGKDLGLKPGQALGIARALLQYQQYFDLLE